MFAPHYRDCTYDENILASWMMANPTINELPPEITESAYTHMEQGDKALYDAMPEWVEVWRGMSLAEAEEVDFNLHVIQQSWSLDSDIAIKFMNMQGTFRKDYKGVVVQATVNKRDVFAYISARDESECVLKKTATLDNVTIYYPQIGGI